MSLKTWVLALLVAGSGWTQPLTDVQGWESKGKLSCSQSQKGLILRLPSQRAMLQRALPSADLRGWRVRLEWTARQSGQGSAGLTLRAGPAVGSQAIESEHKQMLTLDIPNDAQEVLLFLYGRDVQLEVQELELKKVSKLAPPQREPARALAPQELENLANFARLYGYVRYFYPDPRDDWDQFCVRGVRAVAACEDDRQLAECLQQQFQAVAPFLKINGQAARQIPSDTSWWSLWHHHGFAPAERTPYWSKLENSSKPSWFHTRLSPTLEVDLPLTLPAEKVDRAEADLEEFVMEDRATRLAAIVQAWTVLDHFYPYFDSVGLDWSQTLAPALETAATATDGRQFGNGFLRFLSKLQDGHVRLMGPGGSVGGQQCFGWCWVGDHLVVSNRSSQAPDALQPGVVITHVQGKPSPDLLAETLPLVSGSPQYARLQASERMLNGKVRLRLDSGQEVEVSYPDQATPSEKRPDPIAEIRPGLVYVDVTRVELNEFEAALPRLQAARGIVVDCRGYPNFSEFLCYFSNRPMQSAEWLLPDRVAPDRTWDWDRSGRWELTPKQPYLGGKVAFLIDANAISFAESCLAIVEHYRLGPLVGQTTAGCNGNMNRAAVVGGYSFSYTGMKVLRHDGGEHMLRGVRPTHPVTRTLEGIRAGRDEVLERALSLLP